MLNDGYEGFRKEKTKEHRKKGFVRTAAAAAFFSAAIFLGKESYKDHEEQPYIEVDVKHEVFPNGTLFKTSKMEKQNALGLKGIYSALGSLATTGLGLAFAVGAGRSFSRANKHRDCYFHYTRSSAKITDKNKHEPDI